MACCGQMRAVSIPPVGRPEAAPQAGALGWSAAATEVNLRYLEHGAIAVGGPVTGRRYEFSSGNPVQPVDPRDAAVLVRTRFFRQA
jgi:hypothetical protein